MLIFTAQKTLPVFCAPPSFFSFLQEKKDGAAPGTRKKRPLRRGQASQRPNIPLADNAHGTSPVKSRIAWLRIRPRKASLTLAPLHGSLSCEACDLFLRSLRLSIAICCFINYTVYRRCSSVSRHSNLIIWAGVVGDSALMKPFSSLLTKNTKIFLAKGQKSS